MKRFRVSGKGMAGLALIGAALVVGGILTIAREDASAQDADRLCAIGGGGGARAGFGTLAEHARPCPVASFAVTGPDGAAASLDDFHGKVVVVNLWATWCPPCVKEMPSLDRLQQTLGGERFTVVAISQDAGGAAVAGGFLKANGLDALAVYTDPKGAAARALAVPGLPTTIVVDRQGQEVARLVGGAAWDTPEMVGKLRRLGGL